MDILPVLSGRRCYRWNEGEEQQKQGIGDAGYNHMSMFPTSSAVIAGRPGNVCRLSKIRGIHRRYLGGEDCSSGLEL